MKKIYIAPIAKSIDICGESIIAVSAGVGTGNNVMEKTPEEDNEDNEFARRQSSIWDTW